MSTLRVVSGDLIDNQQIDAAKELDRRIRECIRDYVQLGKLLMEMRDGQQYRLLGPYSTFEEYCKDVEGLAYSKAKEKVRAYLVQDAIEQNLAAPLRAPNVETQVKQLFAHENAIAKFKTEKRIVQKRDGTNTPVEVPVAVSNPKAVASQWESVVKEHEAAVARAKTAYESKCETAKQQGLPEPVFKKPPLTGSFVVNHLPPQYQPVRLSSGNAHHFVRWMNSVMRGVESIDTVYTNDDKWQRLISNPDRKKLKPAVVRMLIEQIDEAMDTLGTFKKDLKDEFEV